MPGTVARVAVEPGQLVGAGELLLILEAMKMEHHVVAPVAGTVGDVRVRVGDQVERGTLLLDLSELEPARSAPEGSIAS
jgi:propionyl-CoA carboxylase alpha chain